MDLDLAGPMHMSLLKNTKHEDFTTSETKRQDGIDFVLKISAKSEKSLKTLVEKYHALIKECAESEFEDIIYTANTGRADLDYRFAVCGSSRDMMADRMESYLKDGFAEGVCVNIESGSNDAERQKSSLYVYRTRLTVCQYG